MRTDRSLTVCRSLLPGGGCLHGGCLLWGVSALDGGGVSALGGVCSWGVSVPGGSAPRGVSAPRGSAPRGGSAPGGLLPGGLLWGVTGSGVSAPGAVSAPRGVVSQHVLRQTPHPVNRMTDRCKNITLATTSLRPVKIW